MWHAQNVEPSWHKRNKDVFKTLQLDGNDERQN